MEENRKNKEQVGVIESYDEKCKTVLMRDSEGKSFNVTFSTFRSNWRKYKGDEVIQTSTQVEQERAEVEEAKEEVKKPKREKLSKEDLYKSVNNAQKIVEGAASDTGLIVRVTSKGGISVRSGNRGYAEVWVKPYDNVFDLCLRDTVYESLNVALKNEESYDIQYREPWTLKYEFKKVDMSELATFSEAIVRAIVTTVGTAKEEEE